MSGSRGAVLGVLTASLFALSAGAAVDSRAKEDARRAVVLHHDGTSTAVSGEDIAAAVRSSGHQAVWIWSPRRPPLRRVLGERVAETEVGRLRVEVVRAAAKDRDHLTPPEDLELVIGPRAMWEEIPEGLLPRFPVPASGVVWVPVDHREPQRLRLVGPRQGTWWVDVAAGVERQRIVPEPAPDLRVEVVGAHGEGLAGADLSFHPVAGRDHGPRLARLAGSAEDRDLVAPALPDHGDLIAVVNAPGHVPSVVRSSAGTFPERVRLEPAATVVGRVVDAEGRPIAGASLAMEGVARGDDSWSVVRRSGTDPQGRFAVADLPRGEAVLIAMAQELATERVEVELEGPVTDVGDITLHPAMSTMVEVRDDLGEPIAGAEVEHPLAAPVVTDAAGRARLVDLAPGRTTPLTATAAGHLESRMSIRPTQAETVDIVLRRAFQVRARLLTPDGGAVDEARARVEQGRSYRFVEPTVESHFSLDLEPGVAATLGFLSPRSRELTLQVPAGQPGGERDLGDLTIDAGLVVRGRIVSAASGEPVFGATVWAPRAVAGEELLAWYHGDLHSVTTSSDGVFELAGLAPRPADLRVEAPGRARRDLFIEPAADEWVIELGDVTLAAGATLRVLAAEAADGALARADLRGAWRELDMLVASTSDGVATIDNVPTGAVLVTVLDGRDLLCEESIQIDEGEGAVEVDCSRPPLRIAGNVTVGGSAAGPGILQWRADDPASATHAVIRNQTTAFGQNRQRVWGEGRPGVEVAVVGGAYVTDRIRPGRWQVSWRPEGGASSPSQVVEIPDASDLRLPFSFAAQTLTGRVVDADDQPLAGARVTEIEQRAFALSGSDGAFRLTGLQPGQLSVYARHGDSESEVLHALLEADASPPPVTLRVEGGEPPSVEVAVVDAENGPLGGALVFLEGDGTLSRLATSDRDGFPSFDLRPPMPSRIRVAAFAAGSWVLGSWTDAKEAVRTGLTLVGQETGDLALRHEGEEMAAAGIVSADGWDVGRLLSRVGVPPHLAAGRALEIRGLPAATYVVNVGGSSQTVSIAAGERLELDL